MRIYRRAIIHNSSWNLSGWLCVSAQPRFCLSAQSDAKAFEECQSIWGVEGAGQSMSHRYHAAMAGESLPIQPKEHKTWWKQTRIKFLHPKAHPSHGIPTPCEHPPNCAAWTCCCGLHLRHCQLMIVERPCKSWGRRSHTDVRIKHWQGNPFSMHVFARESKTRQMTVFAPCNQGLTA